LNSLKENYSHIKIAVDLLQNEILQLTAEKVLFLDDSPSLQFNLAKRIIISGKPQSNTSIY
jgi:hypothetical protein